MLPSNSWSPSKRKTFSTSSVHDEDLYPSQSRSKSPFPPSRSRSSFVKSLSRNLYLRYLLSLLLRLFIGRTIFAPLSYELPSLPYRHARKTPVLAPSGLIMSNETLGTAAIIVLNTPSRPDRRDYVALMGAMTNLKFTFMDAWTSKPVEKALPNEHNPGLKDVEYACWRSHADAWRK